MPRQTRSNVGTEPLRWNFDAMSREFNFSIPTLRAALAKNSAVAGEDGCFGTQQIVDSLFGALHLEKIRTQRAMTERITLENQITRAEVLNRSELLRAFAQVADAMVSRIMVSELSREAKEDLLTELSSIPIAVDNVARRQSKLRRSKNGQAVEEEEGES
jgi:hypothetical protein